MKSQSIVYVVDPDKDMSRSLVALLGMYDIRVIHFADAESFLVKAQSQSTQNSCLLLDLELPGADGMSLLRQIRREHQQLPIIVVGDRVAVDIGKQARDAGATDFIERSLAGAYLFHALAELIPGANELPHTEPSIMEMADGKRVTFRMTHPQDAELQQAFIKALSDKSRYMRFFSGVKKLPEHVLKEFTTPRFPISFAVVAIISDGEEERQIGVARWAPTGTEGIAEFAVVVADDCQGHGIAGRLMRLLITAATMGRLQRLEGLILKENVPMLKMVKKMGFNACSNHDAGPTIALYVKDLRDSAPV
ncbi:MAG: GNAT family N-acetyltransferase [Halioglobus sp.]